MPGWSSAYVEVHTLEGGHSDTVNHLSFSLDGVYLASCSDDQSLIVWNIAEGRLLYRVLFKSKVDRVLWHPIYPATLLAGCDNGYLYQLHEFSPIGGEKTQVELGVRGTIQCLAYEKDSRCLAVGVGTEVYVTREIEQGRYEGVCLFPSPPLQHTSGLARSDTRAAPAPRDANSADRETRVRPIDVHFLKARQQLLATYLAHGIVCWDIHSQTTLWTFMPAIFPHTIGSSVLSPNSDELAVYNVVDGVDVYTIRSGGGMKRKPRRTFKLPRMPRTKHALQVAYIMNGRGLICGTTTGDVCVWDTANGEVYQVLNHDKDDIIQAIAGICRAEYSYIATATVDKGQSTYIKVWRAKYVPLDDAAFKSKVYHAVRAMKESTEFSRSKDVFHRWIVPSLFVICTGLLLNWLSYNLPWPKILDTCRHAVTVLTEYLQTGGDYVATKTLDMYRTASEQANAWIHETSEELRFRAVLWLRLDEVVVARFPQS